MEANYLNLASILFINCVIKSFKEHFLITASDRIKQTITVTHLLKDYGKIFIFHYLTVLLQDVRCYL